MRLVLVWSAITIASPPLPLLAQEWNASPVRDLVARAAAARAAAATAPALRRFHSRADGEVFLLVRLGPEETTRRPQLVKADQLAVEVYWEAPNRSKQNILAWRERTYLPTDVHYHRDHLGIITGEFGDAIRLGEGDEVRGVAHPLSPPGLALYDFALEDSLTIRGGGAGRAVTVYAVRFRPRDPDTPAAVGTLYLDTGTAALVRLRFGFTSRAYLQPDLETISVELENALYDQRYWLPYRQEIEIRRRTAWLEFPVQSVIRGRWTIRDYDFETPFPPAVFAAGPYGGLRRPPPPSPADSSWGEPLEAVVSRSLGPVLRGDLEAIRREVATLVGPAATPRPPARLAVGSISEVVAFNRVQGLALGLGGRFALPGTRADLAPHIAYGTSDHRLLGGLAVRLERGRSQVALEAGRALHDVGPWPVASGVLNSILAQERGQDFGDYVLVSGVAVTGTTRPGRAQVEARIGWQRSTSVESEARPAHGSFRPNPALGVGNLALGHVGVRLGPDLGFTVQGGAGGPGGGRGFVRVTARAQAAARLGPGRLVSEFQGGLATAETPPYLAFALGGRGTLAGEDFRAFGGRRAAWARLEWRLPVPVPALPLGRLVEGGVPQTAILAPFVAAGWAGGSSRELPWPRSRGVRPVVGLASDLLFGLLRVEAGWAIRARRAGVVFDFAPAWWPIL